MDNSTESMDNFKHIIKNLSDQGVIHSNKQSKASDITSAETSEHIGSADGTVKSHDNTCNDIGTLKSEYLGKSSSSYFTEGLADRVELPGADDDCGCYGNKHSQIVHDSVDGCHTRQSNNSDAISISSNSISSNNDQKPSICDNCCHGNGHTEKNGCSHRLNNGSTDYLTNDEKKYNTCDKCAISDEKHDNTDIKKTCDTCTAEKFALSDEKNDDTNVNNACSKSWRLSDNKQTCDTSASGHDLPSILMIGLHCCGDLTPTMMKFFSGLDDIKGLCCVSCCYHRMRFDGMYLKYVLYKI